MANQISVNTGSGAGAQQVIVDSNGNITVTVSRSVIGTVANVASANYANFAGNVVNAAQPNITSVGNLTNLNVTNTITTGNLVVSGNLQVGNLVANSANYANFAGVAYSVAGANVSGTVANATFATTAGSANTANSATVAASANSVTLANVSGAGNIASINLDGSTSNVLYGNGIFAPAAGGNTANANYANFAGTAFSVAGANVSGTVANATYALNAGNANFANTATVASSANSVTLANVSGAGNIASINLDGNVANVLKGDGTFGPEGSTGNANYANFAGTVLTNAQPNITSVGNLSALTIDANIANSTTIQTNGNLISYAGSNYYSITNAYNAGSGIGARGSQAVVLVNGNDFDYARNDYYINKGGNAKMAYSEVAIDNSTIGNSGTDPLIPGSVGWYAYTSSSNLANVSTQTGFSFAIGGGGLNVLAGAPLNTPIISLSVFGNTAGGTGQQGIRFRRRGGNNDSRTNVAANYYLGNIEWQGAATASGGFNANSTTARVGAKVESTYANTGPIPTALELQVSNGTTSTHNFHANGNVTFSNVVNATTFVGNIASSNVTGLGNIATINLDGNASNLLNGAGSFVAIPTSVANANYANFAGTVLTNAQPNITSVGNLTSLTVTGNTQGNMFFGSNITFNGTAAVNAKLTVQADLPGATTVRALGLQGGNVSNALASNTAAGGVNFTGGAATSTDAGNAWIARGGAVSATSGTANTANGAAFGGGGGFQAGAGITSVGTATGGTFNLINGSAISNNGSATSGGLTIGFGVANSINGNATAGNTQFGGMSTNANTGNASGGAIFILGSNNRTITSGNATGGAINLTSGNARSENGFATSGNIALSTGPATANISGTATVGSINIEVGAPNGVSGNVKGNINIGTNTNANAINIGATGVAVNLNGTIAGNFAIPRIVNGTSNVEFSGSNGSLLISTSNVTNGVEISGRQLTLNGVGQQPPANNVFSSLVVSNGALSVSQDNIGGGLASFSFNEYENTNSFINPYTFFRARGNASSPQAVANGDSIMSQAFFAYGDSGNTYVSLGSFGASVITNDGAGNVSSQIGLGTANNDDGSTVGLSSDIINLSGNSQVLLSANTINLSGNTTVASNKFMQLSVYTKAALNAITGSMGQIAIVSDSASGGNPNGMMAFWDTTNSRWSYVHDNNAL